MEVAAVCEGGGEGRKGDSVGGSSLDTSVIEDGELDLMDSLLHDVRHLSEFLNRLSGVVEGFETEGDGTQAYCVQVHDSLTKVSRTLKELLDRYHFLRCTEVLSPSSSLIHAIKELKFDSGSKNRGEKEDESYERALAAIQKLQAALAERVGDYLTWEMSHYDYGAQSSEELTDTMTDSYRTTSMADSSTDGAPIVRRGRGIQRRHSTFHTKSGKECLTSEQMDKILAKSNNGIDLAFARAKGWSKYCKEILNFVQRRINLETQHAKEVQKLAEGTRLSIQDEEYMPLQSIYMNSFKLEVEFYENCTDTMKRLYDYKFIKPLEQRKNDHDRKRKDLRIQWDKAIRSVQEAQAELKKSKQQYNQRDQSYRKAMETSLLEEKRKSPAERKNRGKIEKFRTKEEEMMLKKEQANKECQVADERLRQKYQEMDKMKAKILRELRELIYQCDQTTKACTVAYFHALSGLWALLPMQYQTLSENARAYIPGMEYMHFVQAVPKSDPAWTPGIPQRNFKRLPASSPQLNGISKPLFPADDRDSIGDNDSYTDEAKTHNFSRARVPAKCCRCDSYSFLSTVICDKCNLTWHKNCSERTDIECGSGAPRGTVEDSGRIPTFGIPLQRHLADTQRTIPLVVEKCISELDKRGAGVKGLYRVCGTKNKIDQLCTDFERKDVDLSDISPQIIASTLKLYLRQLPEPLLTNACYDDFVDVGKTYGGEQELLLGKEYLRVAVVKRLKNTIRSLPTPNFHTLKYLILHLNRMTWFESENSMSAMNMGIVFGPTLLWREEVSDPLSSLLEAPMHGRAIELLIRYAHDIFDVNPESEWRKFFAENQDMLGRGASSISDSVPSLSITVDSPPSEGQIGESEEESPLPSFPSAPLSLPPSTPFTHPIPPFRQKSNQQRSPASSTDDSNESTDGRRVRKSATPDLLKGRPPNERPPSSPSSSQENDTLMDNQCTSEEDLTSMVINSLPSFEKGDVVVSPRRTHSSSEGSLNEPLRALKSLQNEDAETRTRRRRFERGRPIRRASSKPRNYTTSIFVSPQKFDKQAMDMSTASSAESVLKGRSSDDLVLIGRRGSGHQKIKPDYGFGTVADRRISYSQRNRMGRNSPFRIRLNDSSSSLSAKRKECNTTLSHGALNITPRISETQLRSKVTNDDVDKGATSTTTVTENGDSVQILLSAKPEDLSYV